MSHYYTDWENNPYFRESEFACTCCGKIAMSHSFMHLLSNARHLSNTPFIITSGFRCKSHNLSIGGNPCSAHLVGFAADIRCTNNFNRSTILCGLIKVGFKRLGVYNKHIHVDLNPSAPNCIWLDKSK